MRCRELGIHCAIGVNERESERPGSLYNTLLLIGPDGLLHKHRKLMPTMHERLFHGVGAGDDLEVTETPLGRIGGLICWENRMPLARYAVYRGGPQIWLAPTADDTDGWLASHAPHRDRVGRLRRLGAPVHPGGGVSRTTSRSRCPRARRSSAAAAPRSCEPDDGEVIAGPLYGEEGIVVADCDLRVGLHAKRWFDAAGHYSREDVLARDRVAARSDHAPPFRRELIRRAAG